MSEPEARPGPEDTEVAVRELAVMGSPYNPRKISDEEFHRYVVSVAAKLEPKAQRIEVRLADATVAPEWIKDGSGDFCFTSPPYWEVEWYGDEPGQLGERSYEEFLDGMEAVGRAWLPTLGLFNQWCLDCGGLGG